MSETLSDKTAFITGGARGIGRATALELASEFAKRTPLGSTLKPEQGADAGYLLSLPEAAMITGHTLVVDGGYCISG